MSRNKKIFWRVVIIIICSIFIIFIGANWYIASHLEAIVSKQLEDNTYRLSKGLYHAKIGKMDIHIMTGNLSINDLILFPDSTRLEYLKSVDSIPANYANVSIKSVEFKGVDFKKKSNIQGRHLAFNEIAIVSPHIQLTHNKQGIRAAADTTRKPKTLYDIISPVFDEIKVKSFKLENGQIDLCLESMSDTAVYTLENINFHAEDFLVDSTTRVNNRLLYCEDVHFDVENAHHVLPGKSYSFEVGKVSLSIKDSTFSVEKFKLTPLYPKMEFAYKDVKHSDWMELSIGEFSCKGIHFNDLISKRFVNIDQIHVKDVDFNDFKNQKIVIQHHKMPLLYESFQRLKIPVNVSKIKVENMNVVYEELAKNGTKPGLISFTNIQGDLSNYTNIVSSRNQTYQLVAKAKLLNEGEINATIHLPVDSLNDRFEIVGKLGPMDMTSFNSIIEPLAPAHIKDGRINGMGFHIVGGRQQAKIDMELLYKNLSVTIMKESKDHERSDLQFASILANGLIETNNPDPGKDPRRVQAEWVRDPYHSSFNYLWKIYFSGIVKTLGYTDKREKQVEWIKTTLDKLKGNNHNKDKDKDKKK